ncbi:MAG: hypothetical protein K0Q52_2406, partial [Microbacterium sp.]|nr:hypothetical protein [Microbacterium sp.]
PTYPAAVTLTVVIRDPDASSPAAPLVTMASKIVVTSP